MTNAAEVAKWEAYAARLVSEGKESTSEYEEVMRRLHHARLALAGEQRYLRQRSEDGDKEWARLLTAAEHKKHPTDLELADAIFQYGLEPVSEAALYVARRLVGEVKPPKKRGRPTKARPDDFSLRWLYQMDLAILRDLRASDPETYAAQHQDQAPHTVATKALADQFGLSLRDVERLRKK